MTYDAVPVANVLPAWSVLVAYGVGGVILFVLMAISLVRWLKYARDAAMARGAHQPEQELQEGPTIIAGRVAYATPPHPITCAQTVSG